MIYYLFYSLFKKNIIYTHIHIYTHKYINIYIFHIIIKIKKEVGGGGKWL